MKRKLIVAIVLMVMSGAGYTYMVREPLWFWIDDGAPKRPVRAHIGILSWDKVAKSFDEALDSLRHADVLILHVGNCADADPIELEHIAGRLTPFDLGEIKPIGKWQWDRPLVIDFQNQDSAACPYFQKLKERSWTEFLYVNATDSRQDNAVAIELVRRYKRERTDRMEEMFQK